MSGHSKWSSIKHKKAATDAKRSKVWAKLLRAVEVAARDGGGVIENNPTLASAVQSAKDVSVPNDNIERAIKRGTGEIQGATYEEATYEGYAPGGVAVLVHVLTDNRNRTAAEVRNVFTKRGGNLADPGSVSFLFDRRGLIRIPRDESPDEERLLEVALEAGAEDLAEDGGDWEVRTDPGTFNEVRAAIESAGIPVGSAQLTMLPQTTVPVEGSEAKQVLGLIDALDELDDVQEIFANFDIPEEMLAEVG